MNIISCSTEFIDLLNDLFVSLNENIYWFILSFRPQTENLGH